MAERKSFSAIFFANEYRELAGERYKVTLLLGFLLLLTFCALGFALGGYAELQRRMDNPFTRWVDVTMGGRAADARDELEDFLQTTRNSGRFHLNDVEDWNRYYLKVHGRRHDPLTARPAENAYQFTGRTIGAEEGDALFAEIMREDLGNVVYRSPNLVTEWRNNCGIVATTRMMERLDYTPEDYARISHLSLAIEGTEQQTFTPLYAVVESLPSRTDFLSFPHLYNLVQNPQFNDLVHLNDDWNRNGPRHLLSKVAGQAGAMKDRLAQRFKRPRAQFNVKEQVIDNDGERSYSLYFIGLGDSIPPAQVTTWLEEITTGKEYADYAYCDCAEKAGTISSSDYRTLDFASLDSIRHFQAALEENVGIKIPMEQVESRENFRLVARLTKILSVTLFLFGLLSIVLYLVNLLNNHVDKIRPHLGTFKAMGLPNGQLLSVYTRIALRLLLTATAIGLPLAWVVGSLLNLKVLQVGFTLWHYTIPLAIGLVLLVVSLLVRYRLRGVFATTPGDLIYERE